MHSEQPASSAFSPVGAPQLGQVSNLPEINLFSQLAPFYAPGQQAQPGGITAQQLQLWQFQHMQTMSQQAAQPAATTKSDSKSSSAYASRHQAAEQRRRNRINERLDKLRTLVPHAERANTASFLEEVIHYIEELQALLKCGPNHATGAPATHPSAALAGVVQQQQRQPQAPLDLSGLQGRDGHHPSLGGVQQPPLPQQLPSSAPGMFGSGGPYGVATANGTFEVLQQHHPMAGLHASMGQSLAGLQPLPQQLQQMRQQPPSGSFSAEVATAAANAPAAAAKAGNDPGTPPTATGVSPPSGSSEDNSEGRPLKKRQRGGQAAV